MKLTHALKILQKNTPELVRLGVKSLALFGSTARNEATPTSDVDILVLFTTPQHLTNTWKQNSTWKTCLAVRSTL